MRTASTTLPPLLYGTFRTALIGYGIAGFGWLFTRAGVIEDPFAADASSVARQLFAWGVACQVVAMLARRWARRRFGESAGPLLGLIELLSDGITVLLFAIATFRGISTLAAPL